LNFAGRCATAFGVKRQRTRPKRPHFGLTNKKRLFVEGFVMLRRLAHGPLSRDEAAAELGIPYREWYRWLEIFKLLDIPLAEAYRKRKHLPPEKTLRLWPEDWERLIKRRSYPRSSRKR
jgi:hypothetical protein